MQSPSADFPIDGRAATMTRLPSWNPDVSRSRSRNPEGTPVTSAPASYRAVIRSKARRLKTREPKLGLIIVDYLQLMTSGTTAENRVQEVSQISRNLKVLARDLDVPILAMSQLSRAVEQRHDKRPILSDLRESGSIEQDSDLVIFVYRDEYYNEETDQQGLAEIILAKHRNGPTGTEKLSFLKRYAKFADLAA